MKVRHYLRFMAELRGIPTSGVESAVDEAIERCKLARMTNREIGKLSKGYRQRVGLAQAIIARPTVLLLDEPTASLDPEQINETRQIIRDYAVNAAVIFSTHIMQEIRHVCDHIAIIKNGTIRHTETLRSANGSADERRTVVLQLRGDQAAVAQISAGFGMVSLEPSSAGDSLRLEVNVSSDERELSQLMMALLAREVFIREVVPYESDIENKILTYMKD
jgi:ABC-2 type transport system ATP-binding protein